MKFLPMFDNLKVLFKLESFNFFFGVSQFNDICYTNPFELHFMLYIEKVCRFVEIYQAKMV